MSPLKNAVIYFTLSMPIFAALDFENCVVRQHNKPTTSYVLRNCSDSSYCCDTGCCSLLWYTGPLAVFLVIVVICCVTCVKACWDVYNQHLDTSYPHNVARVRYETTNNNVQILMSPPPAYNVAIYMPQPSATNRIPSYEEVMAEA